MNGQGFRSWPDREVLKPRVATPLWIEFKKPDAGLTPDQDALHQHLTCRCGQRVVVCHSVEEARREYERHRG